MIKRLRNSNPQDSERGSILVMVFILGIVFTAVGASLLEFTISQRTLAYRNVANANALLAAEAGIEQSLHALNEDDGFLGFNNDPGGEGVQEFFNNSTQGRGVFETIVEDSEDSNAKIITAIGRVYNENGTSNPRSERKVRVIVVGTTSEGHSVHSGPGGLILGGSAHITNSDVFVNGTITMTGSSKIGTDANPVNVNVANIACPPGNNPGPTYPALCTSTQPISIADWSTNSYIIGTTCATGQTQSMFPESPWNTNPPQIRAGSGIDGGQGLVPGCTAPPVPSPPNNRQTVVDGITTIATGSAAPYNCSGSSTVTYPANIRLTNSTITWGGSCTFVISGNMHITGNLSIGGSARIRVADSVGSTRPQIVVDGNININGSAAMIANSSGTGIDFISYRSTASCTPTCTALSGNELKTSQQTTTVNIDGSVNLPGMSFNAYWGRARLGGSGNVGALAGQTIDMSGSGTITFGTALSSGSKTWTISGYQRIYSD